MVQQQKKIASFRQSGWKLLSSGDIIVVYGDVTGYKGNALYEKVWDNWVVETTVTEPYEPNTAP